MIRKTIAFTLAETLIVMGIIGIVSALTLPNLNSSTGEKEKVAKVKKIYQNLDDALGRAQAVYGPIEEWFINDTTAEAKVKRFAERMTEFMKVSKNCGNSTGCWSTAPLLYSDGSHWNDNYFQDSRNSCQFFILADGTALALSGDDYYSRIRVDIDGPNKGKTQYGIDIFDFTIEIFGDLNGIENIGILIPSAIPNNWTGKLFKDDAYSTAWVIKNDNMDYLKLDSSEKCPDGKELNWETKTSCK